MLHHFIQSIHATDVYFLGHVSNEELVAYYELADVFLCASEHEGFCVPLIEAFHAGVPVLAYAAAAVPATMDGGGVLVDQKDPILVARLIHEIATSRALQDGIIASQDAALDRLEAKDFAGTLLKFVDEVGAGPRREHPRVAFDFWESGGTVRRARRNQSVSARGFPGAPKGLAMTSNTNGPQVKKNNKLFYVLLILYMSYRGLTDRTVRLFNICFYLLKSYQNIG